jgi:hypothetical protein
MLLQSGKPVFNIVLVTTLEKGWAEYGHAGHRYFWKEKLVKWDLMRRNCRIMYLV